MYLAEYLYNIWTIFNMHCTLLSRLPVVQNNKNIFRKFVEICHIDYSLEITVRKILIIKNSCLKHIFIKSHYCLSFSRKILLKVSHFLSFKAVLSLNTVFYNNYYIILLRLKCSFLSLSYLLNSSYKSKKKYWFFS